MPFDQFIPRAFNPASVRKHVQAASGVYAISNAREWIYVGESDDLQGALLAHFEDFDSPVMKHQPTGFTFEVCDLAGRTARQDRLVLEYQPACNRHSPAPVKAAKDLTTFSLKEQKMQFILTGFTPDIGFRVFAFQGIGVDRTRTEFTVRTDLSLIRQYGIRMQELPLLCRGLLERRDESGQEHALTFTEDEMRIHAVNCAADRDAAQRKKSTRKSSPPQAGAEWPAPQQ